MFLGGIIITTTMVTSLWCLEALGHHCASALLRDVEVAGQMVGGTRFAWVLPVAIAKILGQVVVDVVEILGGMGFMADDALTFRSRTGMARWVVRF